MRRSPLFHPLILRRSRKNRGRTVIVNHSKKGGFIGFAKWGVLRTKPSASAGWPPTRNAGRSVHERSVSLQQHLQRRPLAPAPIRTEPSTPALIVLDGSVVHSGYAGRLCVLCCFQPNDRRRGRRPTCRHASSSVSSCDKTWSRPDLPNVACQDGQGKGSRHRRASSSLSV